MSKGLVCLLALLALIAMTAPSAKAAHFATTCVSGTDKRVIEVTHAEGRSSPCEVRYTKLGETNTVWASQFSGSYCEEKAQELAERLAAAAFKCDSVEKPTARKPTATAEAPVFGPHPAPKKF